VSAGARRLLRSTLRTRRRPFVRLAGWSLVQAVPALLSGLLVSRAVDDGFLSDRVAEGLGWLGVLAVATLVGAWGTRQTTLQLAEVVEPFRDDLVGWSPPAHCTAPPVSAGPPKPPVWPG